MSPRSRRARIPGELAQSDPEALAKAVDAAKPFLGFRLGRVLDGKAPQSPEASARLGEAAMSVVNEHPNVNIRKLYAGQVATQVGMPVADLVAVAERGTRRPQLQTQRPRRRSERRENAEFVAIALLVQTWDEIAPWLVEALFADDVYRRAFVAIAESGGDLVHGPRAGRSRGARCARAGGRRRPGGRRRRRGAEPDRRGRAARAFATGRGPQNPNRSGRMPKRW